MLIVILLRNAPGATALLMLTLVIALYLTAVELRELRPHWKWWAWWTSLVFLTYAAVRRSVKTPPFFLLLRSWQAGS